MQENILITKNVVKRYETHVALNDVSLNIPKGSIYGLLGPNGAGKTTLMKIINQITASDTGEVVFNGENLQRKHSSQIGYLPEERGLYKKMRVGGVIKVCDGNERALPSVANLIFKKLKILNNNELKK